MVAPILPQVAILIYFAVTHQFEEDTVVRSFSNYKDFTDTQIYQDILDGQDYTNSFHKHIEVEETGNYVEDYLTFMKQVQEYYAINGSCKVSYYQLRNLVNIDYYSNKNENNINMYSNLESISGSGMGLDGGL